MKKSYIVGGAAILLLLGIAGYFYFQPEPPAPVPAPPPLVVKPVEVPAPEPAPPPPPPPAPEVTKTEVEPRWITLIKENKPSAKTSQARTSAADANWKKARESLGEDVTKKIEAFGYSGGA